MSTTTHHSRKPQEYAAAQRKLRISERDIRELHHELDLNPRERILLFVRHHWYLPVIQMAIPILVACVAAMVAAYRAAGGRFLVSGLDTRRVLDGYEIAMLVGAVILGYLWLRSYEGKQSDKKIIYFPVRWLYPLGVGALLVAFWFSYMQGGRILYFDPVYGRAGDLFNYVLYIIVFAMIVLSWLIWVDYRSTVLVLTTERVIFNEDVYNIRVIRLQIQVSDIQQVQFQQATYPSVILDYGDLTIQSFSQRRIDFPSANGALEMADAIRSEVNKLKKAQAPETLQRLLLNQVYGEKPAATTEVLVAPRKEPKRRLPRTGLFGWLFPINPEELPNGDVVWRPAPAYIFFQIARPLLLMIAGLTLAAVLGFYGLGDPVTIFLIALITLLGCGGWIFWLREELVNDQYILRSNEIVDVDKRPFGPINRRSAQLDRIQNISFDTNIIETIFGYGTVKIQTGGSGDFSFNHVPDPRGVQSRINDAQSAYKRQDKARQMGDAVSLIKEYEQLRRNRELALNTEQLDAHIAGIARDALPTATAAAATAERDGERVQFRKMERRNATSTFLRRYLNRRR